MTESMLTTIKGKLVVLCQALEQEPLHGAEIMARMALAAQQGGRRRSAPTVWRM